MKNVIAGANVISFLGGENTLLDTKLKNFCLTNDNGEPVLELSFSGRKKADYKTVYLKFYGILEFGFYHQQKYSFFNVEDIKFFITEDEAFYLSLEPDEKINIVSKDDQNFVKATHVDLTWE